MSDMLTLFDECTGFEQKGSVDAMAGSSHAGRSTVHCVECSMAGEAFSEKNMLRKGREEDSSGDGPVVGVVERREQHNSEKRECADRKVTFSLSTTF